ncbi:hypothetical protein Tco_0441815, partial [Tanacetum coccineum]
MGRDTIQLEDAVSTISVEYLLEFTSEYGIPEGLHPELPGLEETIMDFPEGKVSVCTKFFKFANYRIPLSQFLFDILGYYQIHLSQLSVIGTAKVSHFEINCRVLNIIPTLNLFRVFYVPSYNSGWISFSKRPVKNTLQCYTKLLNLLKNWNNRFFWVDERIFPTVVAAPNPLKVKTGIRPHAAHEKSPLDFADEDLPQTIAERVGTEGQVHDELSWEIPSVGHATTEEVVPETGLEEEVATMAPPVNKRQKQMRRKRVNDEAEANAPPKVLRKDHVSSPAHSAYGGKYLAAMGLGAGSIPSTPSTQGAPTDVKSVSDPDPPSYGKPQPYPEQDIAQCRSSRGTATEIPTEHVATTKVKVQLSMGNPESGKSTFVPSVVGSPGDFLSQYNINLARQVAIGSQLRLRFEQQ